MVCTHNRLLPADINPLCGHCAPGFSEWNGECIDCSHGIDGPIVVGSIIVTLIYILILHILVQFSFGTFNILVFFIQIGM